MLVDGQFNALLCKCMSQWRLKVIKIEVCSVVDLYLLLIMEKQLCRIWYKDFDFVLKEQTKGEGSKIW